MQILCDLGLMATQKLSKRENSSSSSINFLSFQLCKCTVCISLHAISNSEETQRLSYNQLWLSNKRLQTLRLWQSHHLNQPLSQWSSDILPNASHPQRPSFLSVTPSIPLMALSLPLHAPIFHLHSIPLSLAQSVSPLDKRCVPPVRAPPETGVGYNLCCFSLQRDCACAARQRWNDYNR